MKLNSIIIKETILIMKKKINVSISGFGNVGKKHAQFIKNNKKTKLLSIFDNSSFNNVNNIDFVQSFNNLAKNNNCDVVIISSPDHSHYEQIIQSLKYKKNIFVEKPICTNFKELKKISEEWKRNKFEINLRSNLILRTSPLFLWLKKKISKNYFGEIYSIDAEYLYGRLNKFIKGWRGNKSNYSVMSGGGIHLIDLVCWLTNQFPTQVNSDTSNLATKNFKLKSKDFFVSTLKFKSGLVFRASANFACVFRHQHTIKIFGTKRTFIYDDLGSRVYSSRNKNSKYKKIKHNALPSNKTNILKDFIENVYKRKNSIQDTIFDLKIMNILCACNLSNKRSKKINIKYII
jgi:predicted dehydrogenase